MLARWRPCSTTSGELYRRYCANKKENAGRVANYLRTMGTIWRALSRPEIMMMGQIAYLDAYAAHPRSIGLDLYRDRAVPPGNDALQTILTAHPEIMAIMKAPTPDASGVAPPPAVPPERIGFSDLLVDADGVVRRG